MHATICLLGPLEVSGPGGALGLSGGRQRALLALLAIRAPETLSRERLIDALWGTAPPPTAVRTLHSHIARVRQALSAIGLSDLLVTKGPGYALRLEPGWVDVERFDEHVRAGRAALRAGDPATAAERFRAGLALWRGDPLAGCPVAGWGEAEITRLADLHADAVEGLAEADLRSGDHAVVAAELERLVVRYPLRERLWELLVIARYRCGRQGDALEAYRRARAVLVNELGVEPGPRLRDLEAAVLAGAAEPDAATAPKPRTASTVPTTTLVGRTRELSEVVRLLDAGRLVTLTGPGGCGKTRLARHVAAEIGTVRPVAMVDLTPLRAPELVVNAVAASLEVKERLGTDRADGLAEALADRDLLLVLDNCEHLLAACAELAGRLLADCPQVTVLATSREALRVAGEVGYDVPPLPVPDPSMSLTLAELADYDSVRLFLDRAGESGARPVTEEDAPAIARLCAALDGLPLAIELAAARCAVLGPAQIARRLRDRFGLLANGAHSGPPHHRALRATLAWSHDLLTPDESTLFARLGVFAGGFTIEAAEAVWERDHTLDALTGLVAKSLVEVRRHGESNRFVMLESVAAFAEEKLRADPAAEAQARERHAGFFLRTVEAAITDASDVSLDELWVELDNLRGAMSWFARARDATDELRSAVALGRSFSLHGHNREGLGFLIRALDNVVDAPQDLRVKALAEAALLALLECDYDQSAALASAGLRLSTVLGDQVLIGQLLGLLGGVARERTEYAKSLVYHQESEQAYRCGGDRNRTAMARMFQGATALLAGDLTVADEALLASERQFRELGNRRMTAATIANRGAVALYRGEDARAVSLLDEAMEIAGELRCRDSLAWSMNWLGLVEHRAGRRERAELLLRASLALHRRRGQRWREASVLEALAGVACASGEPERAAALLREAEEIRAVIGTPVPVVERAALATVRRSVRWSA